MKNGEKCGTSAFTLIELLVVIAIIGILAALLMPALKAANGARDESVALSNMRQIGAAFILYANDNSYMLPNRVGKQPGQTTSPDKWPTLLSKYLSDVRVYASSFDTQNWIIRGLTVAQALSNDGNNTSFIMNGYNDQGAPDVTAPATIRLNAFPNASDIILLGTPDTPPMYPTHSQQYYMDFDEAPNGNENDDLNLAAYNGGSNYLFADGSARFILQTTYQASMPDSANANDTYGNRMWCVNKSFVIPVVGGGH